MPLTPNTQTQSRKSSAEMSDLIEVIIHYLNKDIEKNKTCAINTTIYCAEHIPNISIDDYLKRIAKYLELTPSYFILLLIYLSRYLNNNNDFLHALNSHRLLFSLLLLTHKFIEDKPFSNQYAARTGGISTSEVNSLEIETLYFMGFELYVSKVNYLQVKKDIVAYAREIEKTTDKRYLVLFSPKEEACLKILLINPLHHVPDVVDIIKPIEHNDITEDSSSSSSSTTSTTLTSNTPAPKPISLIVMTDRDDSTSSSSGYNRRQQATLAPRHQPVQGHFLFSPKPCHKKWLEHEEEIKTASTKISL